MITFASLSCLSHWKANHETERKRSHQKRKRRKKMKTRISKLTSGSALMAIAALTVALSVATTLTVAQANAQCAEVVSGLREPLGTVLTNQGNLLVSQTGTTIPDSSRSSLVEP